MKIAFYSTNVRSTFNLPESYTFSVADEDSKATWRMSYKQQYI